MQLLSLAALGPEAQRLLDELSRKLAHDYTVEIIVFAAITLALWIAAAWVAAQAVVKDKAEVGSAMATGFRWLTDFGVVCALAGSAFYFARLRGSATMTQASIGIGAILLLYVAVNTPMRVYKIPFLKGLLFAVIGVLVHLAGQTAVLKAMHDPLMLTSRIDQVRRLAALPPEEASQVLTSLKKSAAPKKAAVAATTSTPTDATPAPTLPPEPRMKTIAERLADLKKIHADLLMQREALVEGNTTATTAYERNAADYAEKLAQLQKDKDAGQK